MSHRIPRKTLSLGAQSTVICAIFLILFFSGLATSFGAASGDTYEPKLFVKCWEYSVTPDLATQAAADAISIYLATGNSELHAVDLKTGAKLWSTELGGGVVSNLLATNEGLLVVTSSPEATPAAVRRTTLRSVSKQTGITTWIADLPASGRGYIGSLGGTVVFIGSDGHVVALGADDGKSRWDLASTGSVTTQPFFDGNSAIFGNSKKEIVRVSVGGTSSILAKMRYLSSAAFATSSDRLIVGDERGNVLSISTDGSTQWKFKNGARISSILPYDSEYIATSFDNFVYKLSRGGNVEWKRRLTGRVAGGPLIVGDAAVVSVVGLGSVYVLNLRNGKISDHFETDEESSAGIVAASPDGFAIASSRALTFYRRAGCAK